MSIIFNSHIQIILSYIGSTNILKMSEMYIDLSYISNANTIIVGNPTSYKQAISYLN